MEYNSKNWKLWQKFFSVEVDQTFIKVRVKKLVKVTRTEKILGKKRPPTLRDVSSKFRHWNSFVEARCLKLLK